MMLPLIFNLIIKAFDTGMTIKLHILLCYMNYQTKKDLRSDIIDIFRSVILRCLPGGFTRCADWIGWWCRLDSHSSLIATR